MPANLSTTRASTHGPSAQVHAARALKYAEATSGDLQVLAASARDLAQLVQQCTAEAARIEQRQHAFVGMQSELGKRLAGERLAQDIDSLSRHAEELTQELAGAQEALGRASVDAGTQGQADNVADQLGQDGRDLDGVLGDLGALREKLQLAGGLSLGRSEERLRMPRRQDVLEEVHGHEIVRAQARAQDLGQELAQAGSQPPAALLQDLEGFVHEWSAIAKDPRELGKPGEPATTDGRVAALQGRWTAWNMRTKAPGQMDPNEMTQWVMRKAYADNTQDMRAYAVRLEYHTAIKARLRDELNRAYLWRSEHLPKDGTESLTAPFKKMNISMDPDVDGEGNWHVREPVPGDSLDKTEEMKGYIKELEQALQTAGDDMQMAQIELQSMTQRQQQVLNTLSSLSKAQHETSMAILRKIGT